MSTPATAPVADFPREELLELLRRAKGMFATEEDRAALRAGLRLSADEGQHQHRQTAGDGELDADGGGAPASARRFATALVEDVSRPGNLEAAVMLARRAIAAIDDAEPDRWAALVDALQRLQRAERSRAVEAEGGPDLETYRQWVGFECLHHYSLADRFFGREEILRQLDAWAGGDDGVSVQCLSALGGAGKSAVAWRWVNGALTGLRQLGYRGAFWCSFYEKSFDFDDFLRRALVFCAQADPADVAALTRPQVEQQLRDVLKRERFLLVIDGLERVMTGYAPDADRAVDDEGATAGRDLEHAPAADRRLTDPRNGAFLRRLAVPLAARLLITTRLEPAELERRDGSGPRHHVGFLRLPGLDVTDAVALWESLAPDCPINPELEAVFALCGNHPLAISILARSVAASGGDWAAWRRAPAHAGFEPSGSEARARAHVIGTCLRDLGENSYDVLALLTTSGKPMTLVELREVLVQASIANGEEGWTVPGSVEGELERLVALGFIGEATVEGTAEFDVHPVIRGAVWSVMSDPRRERFIDHALSEIAATPDPQRPLDPAVLHKATSLFELLVATNQWDRAWEMFAYRLWWPLMLQGAYRELLDLFELVLVGHDPLQLLPLTSRREQANATGLLASLLMQAGDGDRADVLLSWSGVIRLRINDFLGFLDTRHSRTWRMLYEGRLFETEAELRWMKLRAIEAGAVDLVAPIDCWIGIVLALRGESEAARSRFRRPVGPGEMQRWWAQGIAEGYVYLDEPAEALRSIGEADAGTGAMGDERLQQVWEDLTRGMARFAQGDQERAAEDLARALRDSRQLSYPIIECFALPYLAEIRLDEDDVADALDLVDQYFHVDPHSRYRLAAADAWRVRARCALAQDDPEAARAHAARAYQAAACEGPPFMYAAALARASKVLKDAGAFLPRTRSTVPTDWAAQLEQLDAEEQRLVKAVRDPRWQRWSAAQERRREAERAMREANLRYAASEEDARWWDLVTGGTSILTAALSGTMHALGIGIAELRERFERSEHKSLEVVFYQLDADRVVPPQERRRLGDLSQDEQDAWIARGDDHVQALDAYLASDAADFVARPLELELDDRGVEAFLADCARRIGIADASPLARRWWTQLESRRPPGDLLVVAETIQAVPATLDEFVAAISVTGERGLEYAVYALQVERAIARQRVNAPSKTEGWPFVHVLLRLQAMKYRLGWADLDDVARRFWSKLEGRGEEQVRRLLQLAEELVLRESSIAEYHDAYVRGGSDNVQALLCYLDFIRLADREWDGASWPQDISVQRWTYDTATPTFTDTASWGSEQLARRLEAMRERVGFSNAKQAAREWWEQVEANTAAPAMIRVAEELDARGGSISELYDAHVDAATDNLLATLAYLDYSRLRSNDRRDATDRARSHNERANALYREKDYRAAVDEYEGAITEDPSVWVYYSNLAGAWELVPDDRSALQKALEALERGVAACPDALELEPKIGQLRRSLQVFGTRGGTPDALEPMLPIIVEISDALVDFGQTLVETCDPMRRRLRDRYGVTVPGVRFRSNPVLPPGSYRILLGEAPPVTGQVVLGHVVLTDDDGELPESRFEARHPGDGRPAWWVSGDSAGDRGLGTVDYIIAHLAAVAVENLARFVGEQEVNNELERSWARPLDPATEGATLTAFAAAIRGLVDERVAVLDFDALLDAFRTVIAEGGDVDDAILAMRRLPAVRPLLPGNEPGASYLRLNAEIEDRMRAGLRPLGREHVLVLDSETAMNYVVALNAAVGEDCLPYRRQTLVVQDPLIRRYARLAAREVLPHLAVIAEDELAAVPEIETTVALGGSE
jgi:FHIPEP family